MRRGLLVGVLVAGGCAGEASEETGCAVSGWPEVEATVYVAASCPADGDGSKAHPFSNLAAGLASAPDGATIAVAPGIYEESLSLERPVRLVGAVNDALGIILKVPKDAAGIILQVPAPDALGIILKSPRPDAPAITVASQGVELTGFRITGGHVAGVEVKSGSATVSACRVEDTLSVDGDFGSGLVARAGTTLTVRRSVVSGSAGAGLFFDGAGGSAEQVLLENNAAGGLRAAGGEAAIILQDSELHANLGAGLVAFESRGIILKRTTITGTLADAGGAAHGVSLSEGAAARLEDSVSITGNAGIGVLVDGASTATIEDAVISQNERGGVWLQKGAGASDAEGVSVTRSTLVDNGYVGVAATLGASLHLSDCAVLNTQGRMGIVGLAQVEVGDGISIVSGAKARIESNAIASNARLGILADGLNAADLAVDGNTVSNHPVAIILQHPKGGAPSLGANTYADNTTDVLSASEAEAVAVPKDLSEGLP